MNIEEKKIELKSEHHRILRKTLPGKKQHSKKPYLSIRALG